MIHFKQDLNEKALQEIKDFIDLAHDYQKINDVLNSLWTKEVLAYALQLDNELRQKYKTINLMLDIADILPKRSLTNSNASNTNMPVSISRLIQDRYGILTDVLLKKSIIKKIEDFIDYVD